MALHVWKVAVPDTEGVHTNTRSGAVDVLVHDPACALCPLVVPANIPPCGGITKGLAHVPKLAIIAVAVGVRVETAAVGVGLAVRVAVIPVLVGKGVLVRVAAASTEVGVEVAPRSAVNVRVGGGVASTGVGVALTTSESSFEKELSAVEL